MVPLSTVAYLEFAQGGAQEVWGTSGIQGQSLCKKRGKKGQKASAPQKLTLFCYWMP